MIAEFAVQALKTNIFQFNVFATQFSRTFLLELFLGNLFPSAPKLNIDRFMVVTFISKISKLKKIS